jgi:putative phosphoesterase
VIEGIAILMNRPDPFVEKSPARRRVAVLCDIHGNLPALEAVLAEMRDEGVEEVIVGGDVLPGPMPREVLERLLGLEVPIRFLHGNGDREALALFDGRPSAVPDAFRESVRWSAEQLSLEQRQLIAAWPSTLRVTIAGLGAVLCCHATPRNDTEIFTRRTAVERLLPIFGAVEAAVVVCGHTHMAFDRPVGQMRVVNAGSVGMPFGPAGADWLILGPGVELRHTDYDLNAAADRIRHTAYPQAAEFAVQYVLEPPSETKMLEIFAGAELT